MKRTKGVARDLERTSSRRAGRPAEGKPRAKKVRKGREVLSLMASVEEPEMVSLEKLLDTYRPLKKTVNMRMDADVLAWFKKGGRKYQTRINRALRELMVQEMKGQKSEG